MNTSTMNYVRGLNRRNFTNNTQRALYSLLTTDSTDGWVSRGSVRVSSTAARIRDLRKEEFGSFDVVCRSASSLGRSGSRSTFFYRLNRGNITLSQLRTVFEGV